MEKAKLAKQIKATSFLTGEFKLRSGKISSSVRRKTGIRRRSRGTRDEEREKR